MMTKSSVASRFLCIAFAVDIMVGRGLSNKARRERLLLGTQDDAVAAVPFIVGAV